jgi:hypothetical protein
MDNAEHQGRTTPEEHKRFARRAAERAGCETAATIALFDEDPAEYRQLLIDSFDAATERLKDPEEEAKPSA